MADVGRAIDFVLNLEDDHWYPGCISQLRGDTGGRTRLGIAERWHPDLTKSGFYDGTPIVGATNPKRWLPSTISKAAAMGIATSIYKFNYAQSLFLDQITDQTVANELLGFAVNEGTHQAIEIFQRSIGVPVDGRIGPVTIRSANSILPSQLLHVMKLQQQNFYSNLARSQPGLAEYAKGLANRAKA